MTTFDRSDTVSPAGGPSLSRALLCGPPVLLIGGAAVAGLCARIGSPPMGSTNAAAAWLLALSATALIAYLTVVTGLGATARALRWRSAASALDRVTIAPLRRLLDGAVSGLLTLSVIGTGPALRTDLQPRSGAPVSAAAQKSAAPRADEVDGAPMLMRLASPGTGPFRTSHVDSSLPLATPPPARFAAPALPVETATSASRGETVPSVVAASGAARSMPAPAATAKGADEDPEQPEAPSPTKDSVPAVTWHVERGDHLWSIAERTVNRRLPGAGDRDIAKYWLRLIAANRHQVVDPDRIYPGQEMVLPEL